MQWSEVIADPTLRDLPYKIELNKWGIIEMSPASNWHAMTQGDLVALLRGFFQFGRIFVECSIQTTDGVRVPDVAWCSDEFLAAHGEETPFSNAPELCIEVVSPSNSRPEMERKIGLFLEAGAQEVWLVSREGFEFYGSEGRRERSGFGIEPKL
ncbi:MAG: Uma2 family endonuclease [Pseudomonadota bacterium]|nr:Uma2 family endonuclease [Pseudomonadota bacterium]MDP1902900.1 Uma2 family endonuclease [Pseudomonadota bacterium]MDP2354100.1 Uma2 family endonuclease [Pseudomonadota bacterium]